MTHGKVLKASVLGRKAMLLGAVLMALSSCVYYEEFRQRKADADIRQETAELMRQYRHCVEKYETDPAKARENCSLYADALHRVAPKQPDHPMR